MTTATLLLLSMIPNQTKVIELQNAAPGVYHVTITIAEDGTVSISPLKIDATYNLNPNGPQPPKPSERVEALKEVAPSGDTRLSAAYAILAQRIRDDELSGVSAISFATAYVTDEIVDTKNEWKAYKEKLQAYFTSMAQEGATDEDYADLLDDAAISVATDLQELDIVDIISIIKFIIELLKELDILLQQNHNVSLPAAALEDFNNFFNIQVAP